MAKQNRATLKNFFSDGALPSAQQFGELIDSNLNMKDEGFYKSLKNGFEISTRGTSTGLLSFSRDSQPLKPLWAITFDDNDKPKLIIKYAAADEAVLDASHGLAGIDTCSDSGPAITLDPGGWVGVHTNSPGCELDIKGTMRCATRLGTVPQRELTADEAASIDKQAGTLVDRSVSVPADGIWHNITPALSGCHALEVVAGVGKKDKGRYALLHTVALNTFNPRGWLFNFLRLKNRIKCRQAYYRSRADKLALRWSGVQQRFFLQIRSNTDYGDDAQSEPIRIKYHITDLWTDPRMAQSWDAQEK